MRKRLLLLSCLFISLNLFSKWAAANPGENEAASKNDILGTVYNSDNRKPLRDVVVTAYANNKKEARATTDQQGNYSFSDLKAGMYRLVFERDGYRKVSRDKVYIKTDNGFQLDIVMEEINDFDWVPGVFNFYGGE